jgi:coenzyme F420-reducing hydrogenase delta subunit/ferredoxin
MSKEIEKGGTGVKAEAQATKAWQPKIAAFVCNWCTYAGADLAGTSRMEYKPNMRVIRLTCTGRIDPLFLIKAFENGADGVLVSGCHPGDCHYVAGNYHARRRWVFFKSLLDFVGIDERRVHFSWVSASEANKWAKMVDEITETVRALGPFRDYQILTEARNVWDPAMPWSEAWAPEVPEGVPLPEPGPLDAALRQKAKEILEQKQADVVIGYGWAKRQRRTVPLFATDAAEADRLVFNPLCANNLVNYLTRHAKDITALGKPAVVVKSCDVRTLVVLLQEAQVKREEVVILGVPCGGVVYRQELWTGMLTPETLSPKCVGCEQRTPHLADLVVEGEAPPPPGDGFNPIDQRITEIDKLPARERWNYWMEHFDRCIKCYACRQVCPLCYCERCITEKNQPQWIDTSAHAEGNLSWNLIRAIHLAGRCTFCGECDRACPVNIPLNLVNRKLALVSQEAFGYQSGIDPADHPPMIVYKPDDKGEFIR